MKEYVQDIRTVLIAALIIIILLMRSCSGNSQPVEPKIITKIETKYDTITKEVPVYVPKYVQKIETRIDTIIKTQPIDTVAILKDYFATYVYQDRQELDSLNLTIIDSISQNKIFARSIEYDLIYPTTTITKEIYLNNRELYWGLDINGTADQLNYVGGGLIYRNRKKQIYGLGVGIDQNLEPVLSGRLYWKIGK
jgi:hypothetical protein